MCRPAFCSIYRTTAALEHGETKDGHHWEARLKGPDGLQMGMKLNPAEYGIGDRDKAFAHAQFLAEYADAMILAGKDWREELRRDYLHDKQSYSYPERPEPMPRTKNVVAIEQSTEVLPDGATARAAAGVVFTKLAGDTEERVSHKLLAPELGYVLQQSFRKWIEENRAELEQRGLIHTDQTPTGPKGGRPGTTYYLNQAQVELAASRVDTPKAKEFRDQLVVEFNNGRQRAIAPATGLDPNVSALLHAVGQLVGVVTSLVSVFKQVEPAKAPAPLAVVAPVKREVVVTRNAPFMTSQIQKHLKIRKKDWRSARSDFGKKLQAEYFRITGNAPEKSVVDSGRPQNCYPASFWQDAIRFAIKYFKL